MNGGDGVVVVLRSPGELPAGTPGGPGSIADGSDVNIGVAKFAGLHFESPSVILICDRADAIQNRDETECGCDSRIWFGASRRQKEPAARMNLLQSWRRDLGDRQRGRSTFCLKQAHA